VLNDLGGNKASIISHSENYAARNLVIPDEVEKDGNILHIISIAATAFGNCDNLVDSITIGNNVLSIGEGAFRSASNLSGNLFLPPHINSIGSDAFYDCGFNEKLTLHGNIHTIGDNAFDGCSFTSMTCVGFVLAPTLGWGSNLFVSFPDDGTINVVGGSITSEQALSFAKTKGLNNTWTAI
jgi:hypothetical protein